MNLSDVDSEVVRIDLYTKTHFNSENVLFLVNEKADCLKTVAEIKRLLGEPSFSSDMADTPVRWRKDLLMLIFTLFKPEEYKGIKDHLKKLLRELEYLLVIIDVYYSKCTEFESRKVDPNPKIPVRKIKQIDFLCKKKVALKIFKLLVKYGFINKMSSEQILLHCRCSDTKAVLLSEIQKIEWLKSEKALICLINALVEKGLLNPARKWASFGEHFIHKSGTEFKYLRVMNGNKEYYKDYQDPEITALLNEL